mgnify:CR=1 FL=1
MKDNVRQELKELCYFILENNNELSRPEQLTRVQMLYERLLLLNYLEEKQADQKKSEQKTETPKAERPSEPVQIEIPEEQTEEIPIETKTQAPYEDPSPTLVKPIDPVQHQTKDELRAEIKETEAQILQRKQNTEEREERKGINDEMEAPKSINDELGKGAAIQVGLNDRIAFVKHLFNGSQEDFNRVLSQLNTLDTYLESMYFVENLVKPDYNWEDKKPYEDRLIELIKKRFGEDW